MATSGITAWSLTARDIATAALQENGIIALGRDMKAAELNACVLRLNGMVKSWLPGGHLETTGTVTVPADSASGVLAEGVGEIISARLVTTSSTHRPLFRMERGQYFDLPNKAQSGIPLGYYDAQQMGGVTLYLWPVPSVETELQIDYLRVPDTVTDPSQSVDIPEKYQEALYSNLAVRCAGIFGVSPNPELVARAQRLEAMMLDAERPRSYTFEPDCA